MTIFKDNRDDEWSVLLSFTKLERIRDDYNLDLANAYQNDSTLTVDSDVILLVKVMHFLCTEQRIERNISDAQFGERLVGNAIDNAKEALFQSLLLFFPKAKRELLEKQFLKQEQVWAAAIQGIEEMTTPEQLQGMVRQALNEAKETLMGASSGAPSTTSQASSASILDL